MKKEIVFLVLVLTLIFWGLAMASNSISKKQFSECVAAGIHTNEQCRHWAFDE